MSFDALVANPGRLRILTALASGGGGGGGAAEAKRPFVALRRQTGLTDGNLATHARRLESAGLVAIEKSITAGKPLTTLHLTSRGREALAEHARTLLAALGAAEDPPADFSPESPAAHEADDWVD